MANRPTIKDLAREAGLGAATIDRALNGRSNVRQETFDKVLDAAERIGYPTRLLKSRRDSVDLPLMRLGFVLHKASQEFYQNFAREFRPQLINGRIFVAAPLYDLPHLKRLMILPKRSQIWLTGAMPLRPPRSITRCCQIW